MNAPDDPFPEMPMPGLNLDLTAAITSKATVSTNVSKEYVMTTRDKVELALRVNLPKYASKDQAIAATSVLLALVLALATADFKEFVGVPADSWAAVFAIGAIVAAWVTVREWYRYARRPSIQDVVDAVCIPTDPPPQ